MFALNCQIKIPTRKASCVQYCVTLLESMNSTFMKSVPVLFLLGYLLSTTLLCTYKEDMSYTDTFQGSMFCAYQETMFYTYQESMLCTFHYIPEKYIL